MKTLAAILKKANEPLSIEELTIPELKPGQVLVEIAYSGICHSQLNEIRGLKGEDRFLPHTLGHEGSGTVIAIGPDVKKVRVGDNAVLTWIKGSGLDVAATQYVRPDKSAVNSGAISTFMKYSVISENRLVPISKKMPLREAALFGCAISTGSGMVRNTLQAQSNDSLAVFGIGGIGMSAIIAAKISDCRQIIAVDINNSKLDVSLSLGASHVVNAMEQDPVSEIMRLTGGKGVDYAIEAAGLRDTMEKAFSSIRANGGTLIIAGNLGHNEKISIDPFDLIKGKKILGSWGGGTDPDRDIPVYVDLYLSGKLNLTPFIANEYKLEDINQGFCDLEQGKIIRPLINMR